MLKEQQQQAENNPENLLEGMNSRYHRSNSLDGGSRAMFRNLSSQDLDSP